MYRRYCSARHVGLFKLDSAVRKGRKLLDIYRLNDTPRRFSELKIEALEAIKLMF